MGKKLKVQRRGRGTPTFRASEKGRVAPVQYPTAEKRTGVVAKLHHDTGRGAPLAYVEVGGGAGYYIAAPEGIHIGQSVSLGADAAVRVGNTLPLGAIPEGTMVCNIEIRPGDGGRMVRSSGTHAIVSSHTATGTVLRLPSRRSVELPKACRATVGVVAGGGRREKPFLKAGDRFHLQKAKGHVYPKVKGVSMTAASHPHGGGRHRHVGKPSTVSRHASPGRKVGLIAARSTGRGKKRTRRE